MIRLRNLTYGLLAVGAVTALYRKYADTSQTAPVRFIDAAMLQGLAEIEAARLALERTGNDKVKEFARQMIDQGRAGHIVNVASAAAFMPSRMLPAYATSKSAVLMFSECLRAELGDHGIGVSAICPGIIDTPITRNTRFVGVDNEEQERRRQHAHTFYQRRAFTPDRVAQAIVDPFDQLGDGLWLVTGGLVIGMKLEKAFGHGDILVATLPSQEGSKIMVLKSANSVAEPA